MPKHYQTPGLKHYVEAEAAEMGLRDGPDNHHPVSRALENPALGEIERVVTVACDHRDDPATVADSLGYGRDQLDSLHLAYRASVAMLLDAHDGLGAEPPKWLRHHAINAEPGGASPATREVSEEDRAADMVRQLKASNLVPEPEGAPLGFLAQNENPHPAPDPSPAQLADPFKDPRVPNPDPEPGAEPATEPNPEHLPSPRPTADQTPAQAQDLQAGRRPRQRNRPVPVPLADPGPIREGEGPVVIPTPVHGDPPPGDASTVTAVEANQDPPPAPAPNPPETDPDADRPGGPGEEGRGPGGDPAAVGGTDPGPG